MTLEETDLTEEQLMQVRDRSLEEAYEVHDVGHDLLVSRLEAHGFHVVDHGDDARHADEVFMGDGPDLAIYQYFDEQEQEPHGLVAYIEVKTKEDETWFGRCNKRHFKEYVNHANEVDVPVFIWFALVDTDDDAVYRDAFVEVTDTDQLDGSIYDVSASEVVFHEDDMERVDGSDLCVVEGGDVVEVRNDKLLVDGLPAIHGNDVVELNDDVFRSFPYFLHVVGE